MKKYSNYRLDIIPGTVIALISLGYILMIPGIQVFTGMGSTPLTNHFVPYLWGIFLLALGLFVAIRGFIKRSNYIKAGGKIVPFDFKKGIEEKKEVIASFIALAVYVGLMNALGFIIMTFLYLVAQIIILTPKHEWKKAAIPAVIIGLVCAVVFYYIFKMQLNVLLPAGILG